MKFEKITQLIFQSVPEFQSFYKEELDENYYNLFLGDFGLFTRDAIVNKEPYSIKCLNFINDIVNESEKDQEFINMMVINILEILTDYAVTQIAAVKHFNGNCLIEFNKLIHGGYFSDLTKSL